MKSLSLYQEFDLTVYETNEWEFDTHKHNFFELIYIFEGIGSHFINDNSYKYKKGTIFLLAPEDSHSFDIKEKTIFYIITFNKIYFAKEIDFKNKTINYNELFKKLEIIFYNTNHLQKELNFSLEDESLIEKLMTNAVIEMNLKRIFHETIVQNSVFLLLNIIARSIQENLSIDFKNKSSKSEIVSILVYIQNNIYQKEKLTIEAIALEFYKSKNYISLYFKNNTGETLKQYISKYKINLVKNRLIHSNLTISQIANELDFTDDSHLNKIFKQHFGTTAKFFKNKLIK